MHFIWNQYLFDMKTQDLSIKVREDELFKEWGLGDDRFSKDGVVDEDVYLESEPRIMFVLKETNGKRGFDLRSFLRRGGRRATWQNVVRWTHGIRCKDQGLDWGDAKALGKDEGTRLIELHSICVMNVKKFSGGTRSNPKKIREAAEHDADRIKQQFEIYNSNEKMRPRWVLACGKGTARYLAKALGIDPSPKDWHQTSNGVKYIPLPTEGCLVSFYHPQASIKHEHMYNKLMEAVREIRKEHHLE